MKIKFLVLVFLVMATLAINACDWKADIVVIKNNSLDSLLVAKIPRDGMNDSILFNRQFGEDFVGSEPYTISIPNRVPERAPDSDKIYIYIFNIDSVDKYQQLRQIKGIVKQSLLKKIVIQLNKVETPLDTIYINKPNP